MTEAVTKFNQLARICHHLMPSEEERVRRMMEMFKSELVMAIDSRNQSLITVAYSAEREMKAEYSLAQVKEERAQFLKACKEEKANEKQNRDHKKSQKGGPIIKMGQEIIIIASPKTTTTIVTETRR